MSRPRGTTNRNARGSSSDRKARRTWLLNTFGDGLSAPCAYCGEPVTDSTITVDRWPVTGADGGTYVRGNIRPACARCNSSEGGKLGNMRKAMAK